MLYQTVNIVLDRELYSILYEFYDNLINYKDDGECPVGIFCDLSRVDHIIRYINVSITKLRYQRGVQ